MTNTLPLNVEEKLFDIIDKTVVKISEYIEDYIGKPLDAEKTKIISKVFTLKLDLAQGNISHDEYLRRVRRLILKYVEGKGGVIKE